MILRETKEGSNIDLIVPGTTDRQLLMSNSRITA